MMTHKQQPASPATTAQRIKLNFCAILFPLLFPSRVDLSCQRVWVELKVEFQKVFETNFYFGLNFFRSIARFCLETQRYSSIFVRFLHDDIVLCFYDIVELASAIMWTVRALFLRKRNEEKNMTSLTINFNHTLNPWFQQRRRRLRFSSHAITFLQNFHTPARLSVILRLDFVTSITLHVKLNERYAGTRYDAV